MIFLKKKGIKLSEYNLFTMINLAHHNHVTRVNSVWSYSILWFFFCRCFSFFFAVVFLVFFRSFLVFEKISTIWTLLRSSGVSNFSQPLVLKKEIMIMTMKFHYFKNATFFFFITRSIFLTGYLNKTHRYSLTCTDGIQYLARWCF